MSQPTDMSKAPFEILKDFVSCFGDTELLMKTNSYKSEVFLNPGL